MNATNDYASERIERAKWLLQNVKHAAMATVNEDGSPHNTPYFFMASEDRSELYWGSHPDSMHSRNIVRTGQLFVVLYEANERGGLYIKAGNARMAESTELERALSRHNELRDKFKAGNALKLSYYQEPSEQRMWMADTSVFWVNYADKLDSGRIREDRRKEIPKEHLIVSDSRADK